jgi:hypothetical protein
VTSPENAPAVLTPTQRAQFFNLPPAERHKLLALPAAEQAGMLEQLAALELEALEPPAAAPQLVHEGRYALYITADGGRHLTYRPDGAPADVHIPDIPAAALGLVENFLTYGLPPQIVALLGGKISPMKLMGVAREAAAAMGAATNGEAADAGS